MNYLVTGGCGFIGTNFCDMVLSDKGNTVLNIDKRTKISNQYCAEKYKGDDRYKEFNFDLAHYTLSGNEYIPDVVVHFASETHVDRSCEDVMPFINSNIIGTIKIVEYCIKNDVPLIFIGTDEVYGELGMTDAPFKETNIIDPRNPYSASKASGEFMVRSLANASNFDKFLITRCSNNFGKLQDETKLIPKIITSILNGEKFPIYGEGKQIRDWLYVADHCNAIKLLADKLVNGDKLNKVYNIGGNNEKSNIEIAYYLCELMNVDPLYHIQFIKDPRGNAHDFRYAIDCSLLQSTIDWEPAPKQAFGWQLQNTINYYNKEY